MTLAEKFLTDQGTETHYCQLLPTTVRILLQDNGVIGFDNLVFTELNQALCQLALVWSRSLLQFGAAGQSTGPVQQVG